MATSGRNDRAAGRVSTSAAAAVAGVRTCRVGAEKVVHHEVPEILRIRVAHEHVRARVVCPHEIRRHFTWTREHNYAGWRCRAGLAL
jgi:hypothetical protein